MDMRFYWVQYQIHQGHYNVFCKPVATYLYRKFSKHHPPHHHRRMLPVHLHYPYHTNNANARVCNSIHNISIK